MCVRRRASQEVEGWRRRRREWRLTRCARGDDVVPTSSNQITKPVRVTRDAGSLFRPKLGHQYYTYIADCIAMVVCSYIGANDWCFNMDNSDQFSRKNSLSPKMFLSFLAAPDF